MKQIPKSIKADAAKTAGERLGQYKEQHLAFLSDVNDFLNSFGSVEESSEMLRDLHECLQNTLSDSFGVDRCKECDEFRPFKQLDGESICECCVDKFEAEEEREYAASARAGDIYLGNGRYGRPRG